MVSKKKRSSPRLRLIFRKFKRFFRPKSGGLHKKKKKVFTEIEANFSAEIVRFRLVGGMHPEMETEFSKWRLIFRPKSLVLGWWGDASPPPKSATVPDYVSCFSCEQRWSRVHKAQGQGHKKKPRPRTALSRTDPLEAKDKIA